MGVTVHIPLPSLGEEELNEKDGVQRDQAQAHAGPEKWDKVGITLYVTQHCFIQPFQWPWSYSNLKQ